MRLNSGPPPDRAPELRTLTEGDVQSEGWLYLAAVLDVYSRAIVGWAMSHSLGGQLATDALAMAISRRGVPELVHSDRGSTYATSLYLDLIRKHGIRQSMSRKGNCWHNAPMESFFHALE